MVKIRLRREGSKDRPYYKVVVVDSRKKREGKIIELVGNYNPMKFDSNFNVDLEKIDDWIKKGAQPTETVKNLIKKQRKLSA